MESQNGDVRRDLWNHLIQLKQICLEAIVQQQFQEAFECLWGWWLHSLWVTCASAQSSSQEKTVFTCSGRISCFSVCAHCSLCFQDACRCQAVLPQQTTGVHHSFLASNSTWCHWRPPSGPCHPASFQSMSVLLHLHLLQVCFILRIVYHSNLSGAEAIIYQEKQFSLNIFNFRL